MEELQPGIKIAQKNISNLRYADDTSLMAESEEELKNLLMKAKEESGLKLNVQKTKIMASGPITSWQIEQKKVEAEILFSWAPKSLWTVTTAIKLRHLLLGRKAMTNLDSVNRDTTLLMKVHIVKAIVFPVVMYGCESWTIKKAEH